VKTPPEIHRERLPRLELRGVARRYASRAAAVAALESFDLVVEEGEFLCLVGPSGCGKSTLLNLLSGLDRPDEGEVLVHGAPVRGPGRDRMVMLQEPALYPWLTVRQNVEFGLAAARVPRRERAARARELLRLVHLSGFVDAHIHELSGGMRQRAALARALAVDPAALLMDEPFAALDAQTRDCLHTELERIWRETGKTVVFVTHNVREAVRLGDRVLVLSGRPCCVRREFPVTLPRPRSMEDLEVARIAAVVMGELRREAEQQARKEWEEDDPGVETAAVLRPAAGAVGRRF
jgi:NitT/TauT family transport system ATP-binding protein